MPEPTATVQEVGDCVFCRIIAGDEPAEVVATWPDAIAVVPLNPVVPGHRLVIPTAHVVDFTEDATVTGAVMARAAQLAQAWAIHPANLITSAGREATQSVFHLHAHVVPRAENDGLALPWYSGKAEEVGRDVATVNLHLNPAPPPRIIPVPVYPENWIRR